MRIRRSVFADPKIDFTFHRIFGSEKHKLALLGFLNDILQLDDAHRITEVTFLDPAQRPKVEELKLSIVDVKCKDARGIQYVVEMQVLNVEAFDKRVVYNVAKAYTNQLDVGEDYPKLNDIVGITICDFEMWPREKGFDVPMVSRWRLQEQQSGTVGLLALQFVFLELPKYDVQGPPRTTIEKWAYFFREARKLKMVPDALNYPPIVDALDAARTATFTVDEWDHYIRSGMAIQNERGMLSLAEKAGEERGIKKGIDIGKKEGIDIGKKEGIDIGKKAGIDIGKKEGIDIGKKEGIDIGKKEGLANGLRQAVRDICDLLSIELTAEKNAQLDSLDSDALARLCDRIKHTKRWE